MKTGEKKMKFKNIKTEQEKLRKSEDVTSFVVFLSFCFTNINHSVASAEERDAAGGCASSEASGE